VNQPGARPYGQRGRIQIGGYQRNAEGQPLCRWCGQLVTAKRRQWWCGKQCVDEWRERGQWSHIREQVIARDKVCRTCGGQRYHALNGGRIIGSAERVAHWIRCGLDLAGPYVAIGRTWEVDHIVAVADGGTDDPANLRLLCGRCHRERTAAQRRERAVRRSQESC